MVIKNLKTVVRKLFGNSKDDSKKVITNINYKGYKVFYSEGTSLIERIKKTGEYEPEVTKKIITELISNSSPIIIDIGANIGLISLSVLAEKNKAKIFAFEPGPHQNKLFKQTIVENKLDNTIILENIALSNKKGYAKFRIHNSNDASGDGFIDTERAGPTKSITVQTDTLDNWWNENRSPNIDFIKMDTEGSEYYILQGAKDLIKALKPKIIIEINTMNIKNYPFSIDSLFQLITSLGYEVYSMENIRINSNNIEENLKKNDTYLLIPVIIKN